MDTEGKGKFTEEGAWKRGARGGSAIGPPCCKGVIIPNMGVREGLHYGLQELDLENAGSQFKQPHGMVTCWVVTSDNRGEDIWGELQALEAEDRIQYPENAP